MKKSPADDAELEETLDFFKFSHSPENGYKGTVCFRLQYPEGNTVDRFVQVDPAHGVKVLSHPPAAGVDCTCRMSRGMFFDVYMNKVQPHSAVLSGQVSVDGWRFGELRRFATSFNFSSQKWADFYASRPPEVNATSMSKSYKPPPLPAVQPDSHPSMSALQTTAAAPALLSVRPSSSNQPVGSALSTSASSSLRSVDSNSVGSPGSLSASFSSSISDLSSSISGSSSMNKLRVSTDYLVPILTSPPPLNSLFPSPFEDSQAPTYSHHYSSSRDSASGDTYPTLSFLLSPRTSTSTNNFPSHPASSSSGLSSTHPALSPPLSSRARATSAPVSTMTPTASSPVPHHNRLHVDVPSSPTASSSTWHMHSSSTSNLDTMTSPSSSRRGSSRASGMLQFMGRIFDADTQRHLAVRQQQQQEPHETATPGAHGHSIESTRNSESTRSAKPVMPRWLSAVSRGLSSTLQATSYNDEGFQLMLGIRGTESGASPGRVEDHSPETRGSLSPHSSSRVVSLDSDKINLPRARAPSDVSDINDDYSLSPAFGASSPVSQLGMGMTPLNISSPSGSSPASSGLAKRPFSFRNKVLTSPTSDETMFTFDSSRHRNSSPRGRGRRKPTPADSPLSSPRNSYYSSPGTSPR